MKKIVSPRRNVTQVILFVLLSLVLIGLTYYLFRRPQPLTNIINVLSLMITFVMSLISLKAAINSWREQAILTKDFYPLEMRQGSDKIQELVAMLVKRINPADFEIETNAKGIRIIEPLTAERMELLATRQMIELDSCILMKNWTARHYQLLFLKYQVTQEGDHYQLVPLYCGLQKFPFRDLSMSTKLQDLDKLLFSSRHYDIWDSDYDAFSNWMSELGVCIIAAVLIFIFALFKPNE